LSGAGAEASGGGAVSHPDSVLDAARRVPPRLVFAVGNPSRGDDALGPLLAERIAALALPGVEVLTDFQLQVEHALDLVGRGLVIFVDASVAAAEPFTCEPAAPARDASYTSHALSPAAVLDAYTRVVDAPLPPTFVVAIRGYEFELGAAPSDRALANLEAAVAEVVRRLR
jgi:hydrogenase maturation protease